MNQDFLDFEQPIADLQAKIKELRLVENNNGIDLKEEIERLQVKQKKLTRSIFSSLDSWQVARLARHPLRPYTLDYIDKIFTEFNELHGDRHFADDAAIVAGLARLDDISVMVIGHQKARKTQEKIKRNFGMPKPEGYRKALRLMKLAERFNLPIITFIDTPGAYPGIGAEERGQSEAIARNLYEMAQLKTPIICTVIGEGGSGGALAIGVGDHVAMLQYSIYSVITPEGCASILWRNVEYAQQAAEAMGITADKNKALHLIDSIVSEPEGGAHRDADLAAAAIKENIITQLKQLQQLPIEKLLAQRYQKLLSYGVE